MATIWEITEDALDGLGVPIAADQMLSETGEALPDLYLVYSLVSSPPEQHADDAEKLRHYRMQVSAYNRAGLAALPDVDGAMTAARFTRSVKRGLPYNPQTRHYGLAMEYLYLEQE